MAAGDKKYGRNKKDAQRYQIEGRLDKNRKARMARHAKRMAANAARRAFYKRHGMSPAAYERYQGVLPRSQREAA